VWPAVEFLLRQRAIRHGTVAVILGGISGNVHLHTGGSGGSMAEAMVPCDLRSGPTWTYVRVPVRVTALRSTNLGQSVSSGAVSRKSSRVLRPRFASPRPRLEGWPRGERGSEGWS
jgi:hypothetical protein